MTICIDIGSFDF